MKHSKRAFMRYKRGLVGKFTKRFQLLEVWVIGLILW